MTRKERIKKALQDAKVPNITDEMVDTMDKAFGEELDGNFIPKGKFDEVNEQLKAEKATNKTLNDNITKLKAFEGTNEELKTKISSMEEAAKTEKANNDKKFVEFRKKAALKMMLAKDKAQDADLILGMLNLDEIEIDDNDKITSGYKEKVAAIKKEKPYLFKAEENGDNKGNKYAFLKGPGMPGDGDAGAKGDGELTDSQKILKSVVEKGKKEGETSKVGPDYFFGGAEKASAK